MLLLPIFNPSLGRREKLPQKVGSKEKLAEKVGRREMYPPVPPPLPPLGRKHTTFTSCQNNCFLCRVDYALEENVLTGKCEFWPLIKYISY